MSTLLSTPRASISLLRKTREVAPNISRFQGDQTSTPLSASFPKCEQYWQSQGDGSRSAEGGAMLKHYMYEKQ